MPERRQARRIIVAIDGPAGAGKSTVAKRLAKELGYTYMDTGAMYRAFAWKVLQAGIDPSDENELKRIIGETKIELSEEEGRQVVFLDGQDIADKIRTPELSQMASKISSLRTVRERMVELQREMGRGGGIVAEGRDMGTVVFPEAEVKIYLDASPRERARRRFEELRSQGKQVTMEETVREMDERDQRDKGRAVAPLSQAADAVVVDSTGFGVDGVAERIMQEIRKKLW